MIYIIFILLSVVVCPGGSNLNTITLIGGDFTLASSSVPYLNAGFEMTNLQTINGDYTITAAGLSTSQLTVGNSGFNSTFNKSLIANTNGLGGISCFAGLINLDISIISNECTSVIFTNLYQVRSITMQLKTTVTTTTANFYTSLKVLNSVSITACRGDNFVNNLLPALVAGSTTGIPITITCTAQTSCSSPSACCNNIDALLALGNTITIPNTCP